MPKMQNMPLWRFLFAAAVMLAANIPSLVNAQTVEQIRIIKSIPDATAMTYDAGHGTQIEYTSADGKTYLWYPGNTRIVPGRYKIDNMTLPLDSRPNSPMVSLAAMCFRYGANSHNPATGRKGGDWECLPLSIYADRRREVRKGDIFGLSGRQSVPFKLDKKKTSLSLLLKKCKDC